MKSFLSALWNGKKAGAAAIAALATLLSVYFPGHEAQIQNIVYGLVAYIFGQGLADFGKEAKKE